MLERVHFESSSFLKLQRVCEKTNRESSPTASRGASLHLRYLSYSRSSAVSYRTLQMQESSWCELLLWRKAAYFSPSYMFGYIYHATGRDPSTGVLILLPWFRMLKD